MPAGSSASPRGSSPWPKVNWERAERLIERGEVRPAERWGGGTGEGRTGADRGPEPGPEPPSRGCRRLPDQGTMGCPASLRRRPSGAWGGGWRRGRPRAERGDVERSRPCRERTPWPPVERRDRLPRPSAGGRPPRGMAAPRGAPRGPLRGGPSRMARGLPRPRGGRRGRAGSL